MKVRLAGLGIAVLGCAVAIVSSAAVASADPPDPYTPLPPGPHIPDMNNNYCPGRDWAIPNYRKCDGEPYPDGSFWHQEVFRDTDWDGVPMGPWRGHTWCASDFGNFFAQPSIPGGCDGAVPPDWHPPAP